MALSKIGSPNPVAVGGVLTYTITVTNNGPSTVNGVILTDTLPAGVSFTSASSSQGPCGQSLGVVTCGIGTLTSGGSATVTIIVTANAAGMISNMASVNPGNRTVTAITLVGTISEVPTLSESGLLALGLLLAAAGALVLLRKGTS